MMLGTSLFLASGYAACQGVSGALDGPLSAGLVVAGALSSRGAMITNTGALDRASAQTRGRLYGRKVEGRRKTASKMC